MKNRLASVLLLLIGVCFSANVFAWTRIPATTPDDETAVKAKPKKAQPAKVTPPVSAPAAQTPLPKPVQVPAAKPAPPSVKTLQPVPVRPSVIKPAVTPAITPPVKPAVTARVKTPHPFAAAKSQSVEWIAGAGLELGGEELGQVTYSDGSTAPVNANNGIMLNFGGIFANGDDSAFSTQISLGYKSGGPRIWSSDVNWSAMPLDIIEHYRIDNLRLGLGITYHFNPQLKVNLPSSSFVNKYNNSIGILAQISWAPVRENYSFDLRYTSIKFQQSDLPSAPLINGSVGGLYATYRF